MRLVLRLCIAAALLGAPRAQPSVHQLVFLRGVINGTSAAAVQRELLMAPEPQVLYIDTGGGHVHSGIALMHTAMRMPRLICIVQRAYSMGFALLQVCAERWMLPGATLMQHQTFVQNVSGTIESALQQVMAAYADYKWLLHVQAERMRTTVDTLHKRLLHEGEWWLDARSAVAAGCADRVVSAAYWRDGVLHVDQLRGA